MTKNKTLIVTADLQRGKRQYSNPDRVADYVYIWEWICKLAATKDGLIVAGDGLDSPKPTASDFIHLTRTPNDLGVKETYIIDGNHDGSETSWFSHPTLGMTYMEDKRLTINDCQIHFLNYRNRPELLAKLKEIKEKFERTDVIVGHQMSQQLAPTIDNPNLPPIGQLGIADMISQGWENLTLILGDVHTSSDWTCETSKIEVIYPGSPEMTEKGEGKHKSHRQKNWEDNNCYVLEWTPKTGFPQDFKRVLTDHRPRITLDIKTSKKDWEIQLQALIERAKEITQKDHLGRKPIVNVWIESENQHQLNGTYWDTFLIEIPKVSCTFDFRIDCENIHDKLAAALNPEISLKQNPNKGIEELQILVSEATQDSPNQKLIEELARLALDSDKNKLEAYIQELAKN
jgi:DNA repair exonuclease SbcCD nuclease subunit